MQKRLQEEALMALANCAFDVPCKQVHTDTERAGRRASQGTLPTCPLSRAGGQVRTPCRLTDSVMRAAMQIFVRSSLCCSVHHFAVAYLLTHTQAIELCPCVTLLYREFTTALQHRDGHA